MTYKHNHSVTFFFFFLHVQSFNLSPLVFVVQTEDLRKTVTNFWLHPEVNRSGLFNAVYSMCMCKDILIIPMSHATLLMIYVLTHTHSLSLSFSCMRALERVHTHTHTNSSIHALCEHAHTHTYLCTVCV